MNDSQFLKVIEDLTAKCIRLEARCDALDTALCVLAIRHGIPRERIEAAIDKATALHHQKRLERIESLDPGLAASLDRRAIGDVLGL